MKVLYLYPTPRKNIYQNYQKKEYPDTLLMSYNHLSEYSIDASFFDPEYDGITGKLFYPIDKLSRMNNLQQIKTIFNINNFDIIVIKDIKCGYLLTLLKKLAIVKKPMVLIDVVVHEKIKAARMLGYCVSSSNKIVYCATSLKKILIESFRIPEEKLEYVPWSVDSIFFQPMAKLNSKDFIFSAGTNDRDYETLIRTAKNLSAKVKIATNRRDIADSGYVKKCFLSPIELRKAYAESLFVVVPLFNSPSASGVTTILEAMAMKKAVIVSASKGVMDYIEDGKNALLVKPNDPKELTDAISYLLENPDVAEKLGENGRKIVQEKFNTKTQAKSLVNIYKKVIVDSIGHRLREET